MTAARAYTSTVVATAPALVVSALAAVPLVLTAAIVEQAAVWVAVAVSALIVTAVGVHLGTVRLSVGADGLRVGHGPRWSTRRIGREDVVTARSFELSRMQVYGLGNVRRARTARLAVRPGPAVEVGLRSGEWVVVSTPNPDLVIRWIEAGDRHREDVRS